MVITKPTIDDFSDTTVMRVIRKIVEYIIDTLVPAINEGGGGSSYVLPPATKSTLGGIIVGDNLTVDGSGKVNAPTPYTLPIGGTTIGGVKNGGNVTIEADGTMNTTGGSSDDWEVLTLSNLPTDFAIGDELEIVFKASASANSIGSWDIEPTSINITASSNILRIARVKLSSNTDSYFGVNVFTLIKDYGIITTTIDIVYGVNKWNSQTNSLFTLKASIFNGAGNSTDSQEINRSNISSYVYSMKRKKQHSNM